MESIEQTLADAGRQRHRVLIRFRYQGEHEVEHEREMEPYAIRDGALLAFSVFRNEFRTLPLEHIVAVEVRPNKFEPRRPVEFDSVG